MTPFSDILGSISIGADGYQCDVPADWLQGRTTYGGLSAALCLSAAERVMVEAIPLRSAQFCFVGPASGLVRAAPAMLRQGKATLIMAVDLHGPDGLAARALLVFGRSRSSAHDQRYEDMPTVSPPEQCDPFFGGPGTPQFARHFETRRAGGDMPMTAAGTAEFLVWVRHIDQRDGSGVARLVAMGDTLPTPASALFDDVAPFSTVTWSFDLPNRIAPSATGWHLVRSRAESIHAGYATQAMSVWSADGQIEMLGRQNVAIFA